MFYIEASELETKRKLGLPKIAKYEEDDNPVYTAPNGIYTEIEKEKEVYVFNCRTKELYKITFSEEKDHYNILIQFNESEKEEKLEISKKSVVETIILGSPISMFISDNNIIHFIAPEEIEFYE